MPKWTLQHHKNAGAEEKDREGVARPDLADGKIAQLPGERCAPKEEGDAKDRPALEKDAGPLVFREEK